MWRITVRPPNVLNHFCLCDDHLDDPATPFLGAPLVLMLSDLTSALSDRITRIRLKFFKLCLKLQIMDFRDANWIFSVGKENSFADAFSGCNLDSKPNPEGAISGKQGEESKKYTLMSSGAISKRKFSSFVCLPFYLPS